MQGRSPISTVFPYTTLFRSAEAERAHAGAARPRAARPGQRPRGDRHAEVGPGHVRVRRVEVQAGGDLLVVQGQRGLEQPGDARSEVHTSELQSLAYLVCRLL